VSNFDPGVFAPADWLTLGRSGGAPVLSGWHVLATGLDPGGEQALVGEALTSTAGPAVFICEGPDISIPVARPVIHYDITGRCRETHAHAFFDPALPSTAVTQAAQQLFTAFTDPEGGWQPPGDSGADFAALVQAPIVAVLPVLAAALWAAGSAGYGVREAMDWLAADQLPEIVTYCRKLAGQNPPRFVGFAEDLINGPAPARQQAVYAAWQTLAPVEAMIRNSTDTVTVERLDVGAWLSSQAVLAVSLAPGAGVTDQQILAALLATSHELQKQAASRTVCSVWRDMPKPKHCSMAWLLFLDRALVTTNMAARFRDWSGSGIGHDLLLGSQTVAESLEVAGAVAQRPLAAPPPGQVILVRSGAVEQLSAPGASTRPPGGAWGPGRV
jgi:hypothetical protein